MILDRLVFLLTLAMSLVSAEDYRTLENSIIRPEFREIHEPSCGDEYTLASCFSTYCKSKFCAVEFDEKTGGCFTIKDKYSMLFQTGVLFLRKIGKSVALTKGFLFTGKSVPDGFWLFDSHYKGVNLGTKGKSLDWKKFRLLPQPIPGPRGSLNYPKLAYMNSATLDMVVGVKRLLSLKEGFTMCLWVKPDAVERIMPILEESQITFQWWFHTDKKQRQMFVKFGGGGRYTMFTKIDESVNRSKWRHIAIVFKRGSGVKAYQNAKELPELKHSGSKEFIDPKRLKLGFRSETVRDMANNEISQNTHEYRGSMACLSIISRALSKAEIKIMMDSCP